MEHIVYKRLYFIIILLYNMSIVNALWIGKLGKLQLLSINSFLKQGHKYILWIYPNINKKLIPTNIPKGVIVKDANKIFNKKYIFKHWSGNYATFADMFRFKLLHEKGGWWVDLDLICLRKLPDVSYFFGGERRKRTGAFKTKLSHSFWIGLMRFPKNNLLLKKIYTEMLNNIDNFKDANNKIPFTYGQQQLGLQLKKKYGEQFLWTENKIDMDLFNPLAYNDMIDFYKNNTTKCCKRWGWPEQDINNILKNSYTIHVYNTIIKNLDNKYGYSMYLIKMLEEIIYN